MSLRETLQSELCLCAHQQFCQINDLPELRDLSNNNLNINESLPTRDYFIPALDNLNITVKALKPV